MSLGSAEQHLEPFLLKVSIIGENVGQSFVAHRLHRNAISQAVAFIGAGFVQREAGEKIFRDVGSDPDRWEGQSAANVGGSLAPEMLAPLGKEIQILGDDLFGRRR